jgi:hypothetical protein
MDQRKAHVMAVLAKHGDELRRIEKSKLEEIVGRSSRTLSRAGLEPLPGMRSHYRIDEAVECVIEMGWA